MATGAWRRDETPSRAVTMRLKPLLANGALLLGSVAFFLVLAEIALWFLPVNEGFNFLDVDETNPLFRATPEQDVVSSRHWDLYGARTLHVNNAGFRNDQDYVTDPGVPVIAVVGDSYVEAIDVAYEETFFGRLAGNLDPKAKVYSFGFSGAPLSQYLVWSRYARDAFAIDYLVVGVVGNDFDESLAWYKQGPGFHHYAACGDAAHCLKRVDYHRSLVGSLALHSALARYLAYNLGIFSLWESAKSRWHGLFDAATEPAYVGNVSAEADERRLADSRLAADLFLRDVTEFSGLPASRITFVVDGRIYEESEAIFDRSYFGVMRAYFVARARDLGFNVVDMRPVFSQHYREHGLRFESTRDGHWNALGHELIARELGRQYRFLLD